MARSKTKLLPSSSSSSSAAAAAAKTNTSPQDPNANANANANEDQGSSLIPLLTSAISLSLRFLSDTDLLLHPSQSLLLTSLLRSSALSLSSLLSLLSTTQSIPIIPPPPSLSPSPSFSFSWFRRFLSSSSSPSDPRWLDNFRMSKPSFYLLLTTLSPSLLSLSASSSPLPPDLKLAAALFRLSHAAPFPFIARRFGLPSPSLAARSFYEVVRSLTLNMSHLFELSSDVPRITQGFNWMSLPNCCGALAFSRFPVHGPMFRSVVAQCVVDSECRFLDVSVGWHGSMRPDEILTKTKLYTAQSAVLGGNEMPVPNYFIGGSCCPLLPWLLTPFKDLDSGSSSKAAVFNTVHARGMELADRAFRRLRARWKLLRMEWKEECVEALPYVVVASCLLHNYLIKCSEPIVAEEVEGLGMEMGFKEFEGKGDEEGERIRDVIASHLSQVIHK